MVDALVVVFRRDAAAVCSLRSPKMGFAPSTIQFRKASTRHSALRRSLYVLWLASAALSVDPLLALRYALLRIPGSTCYGVIPGSTCYGVHGYPLPRLAS